MNPLSIFSLQSELRLGSLSSWGFQARLASTLASNIYWNMWFVSHSHSVAVKSAFHPSELKKMQICASSLKLAGSTRNVKLDSKHEEHLFKLIHFVTRRDHGVDAMRCLWRIQIKHKDMAKHFGQDDSYTVEPEILAGIDDRCFIYDGWFRD